jgi:tripartite-type tricarboxylate transporter receptor subunit TctC
MLNLRVCLFASLLCATPLPAAAQSPPELKPIRIEVGTAPGGLSDLVPRELSNYLSTSLGVPVVVENRPGAGGNIAASVVAKAPPDGHTLFITGANRAVNPILLPNPGFDYDRDLAPVAMAATADMLLVSAPGFPAKNIGDVIAIAKRKPKSVSIAISVIGSPDHLGAEMLAQYGGIDLTFVPYPGISKAIPDLMANRVDLAVGAMPTLLPQVRSGALRGLAVASSRRSRFAPEIPTSAESGLPSLQIDGWVCILTTGGTPAPLIARLDAAIARTLALPEVRDFFAKQHVETLYMDSEQLGKFVNTEAARLSRLLKNSQALGGSR